MIKEFLSKIKALFIKENKEINYACPKCKKLFIKYNNENLNYVCNDCQIYLSIKNARPFSISIIIDDSSYNIFTDKSISFVIKSQLQYNAIYDFIKKINYDSSFADGSDEYDYDILYKILTKYIDNEIFK